MTTLDDAQRMNITALIRDAINGHGDVVVTSSVAEEVSDRLWELYDAGEPWVVEWLREYSREGIRRRVVQVVKGSMGTVLLSGTGTVISVPTHVGMVAQTEDGRRAYQLKLWWELTWPQYLDMVAERSRQRRVLTHQIRAFNEITRLRDRYPTSETPGEACRLAGKDPLDFRLEELLGG